MLLWCSYYYLEKRYCQHYGVLPHPWKLKINLMNQAGNLCIQKIIRLHCYWKQLLSLFIIVSDSRKKSDICQKTESFPFKLGHKVSSWTHPFGAPACFRAPFYWTITSPVKTMGCKGNNANVWVFWFKWCLRLREGEVWKLMRRINGLKEMQREEGWRGIAALCYFSVVKVCPRVSLFRRSHPAAFPA